MAVSLSTKSPLSYSEWIKYQDALNPENNETAYFEYVQSWYKYQKDNKNIVEGTVKQQFIQLVKDLSFLFANSETNDIFLKNIDYNNDEDLIYAIPFFARKLRQIAVVLQKKRESVKNAKLKYNLVGSNEGLEKLLYEYVLKGFTTTENSITQVPASPLISFFPDLSSVKDSFFIELEELHDTQTYFDSDPTVDILNYIDTSVITDSFPLSGLTDNELNAVVSTRFFPRVAENLLSNIFRDYYYSLPSLSTTALSADPTNLVYNEIGLTQKYLGEPVYGLTAVRLREIDKPDLTVSINMAQGNNWFYWPSGNKVVDDSIFNNLLEPISINDSSFIICSATGGSDYTNSDLLFTDKNGVVEGAWLQGPYSQSYESSMRVVIDGASTRDFIFPFPGVSIASKSLEFQDYSLIDNTASILNSVSQSTKNDILNAYYTNSLPPTASNPLYLNQTKLITQGSYSSKFSIDADNILIKTKQSSNIPVYSDSTNGAIEQAYLYKFDRTDLPVTAGLTKIHWPVLTYTDEDNSPLTIKTDFCLPIKLSQLNPSYTMVGAVAGTSFNNSDVIYKFNTKNGEPIEAAYLGSKDISYLDNQYGAIDVYGSAATKCSTPIEGSVQSSLSFVAKPTEKISFVWMDPDTPADQVFKYREHLPSCQYGKTFPHDLYKDQDYQNPNPINKINYWSKCTCKSVNYSPIGHGGDFVSDFNGMADYLFADPDGVGEDFAINTWTDTRGYDVNNSPQFAFFKLSDGDVNVGWGNGFWKTGNGSQMILKTGKRYTYYRSALRTDTNNPSNVPYFISNYAYKNIQGLYDSTRVYDLVILIDISKSQYNNISKVKTIVSNTVEKIMKNNPNVQVSLVTFGSNASKVSWLTTDYATLQLLISQIEIAQTSSTYQTNISDALILAGNILLTPVKAAGTNDKNFTYTLSDICNRLNYSIISLTTGVAKAENLPNENATKKILVFSDGFENINEGLGLYTADVEKATYGIEIYGVDIGELSDSNILMERMSSSLDYYFNLEKYLRSGDGDVNNFSEYISLKLGGNISIRPTWYKAIRNDLGNWQETNELSDMILTPGDYIAYVHRGGSSYNCPTNVNASFTTPSISFTINVKLDGWDYITNTFNSKYYGESYGGKPFWAKVYNTPDADNNFFKGTMSFGGQVRFFDDYVPLHQPEISSMILNSGDNVQYVRKTDTQLIWEEPLTLNVSYSSYIWNKLLFNKDYSNLSEFLKTGTLDGIVNDTNIMSDLTLESYSTFKPAYYNYYARNPFKYTQDLYYLNRCLNSFVYYNTGLAIQPLEPYANMDNIHYPTVASVSFPSQAVTTKQVGEYLLPEKLGTSYYRGKGYQFSIDNDSLTNFDSISSERLYLDINKYGGRNRGLSKKDQLIPVKVSDINNSWIMEPYSSGDKGGVLINTLESQKLTPYQTSYEIYGKNYYGLARQDDMFQFWSPAIPGIWNDSKNYPLTFRQELPASEYIKRKEKLLTNKGSLNNWRSDIYGNEYGLYKKFAPSDLGGLYMWFSADYGTISEVSVNPFIASTLSDVNGNADVSKWLDRSGKNNNLFASLGNPQLVINSDLNNQKAIYFDNFSNLTNGFNIDTSECTMYIVGSYPNAYNNTALAKYQIMAGFGNYISAAEIPNAYPYYNTLTFANQYGDFQFNFGNNSGYITPENNVLFEINLTDYYYNISGFFPPTKNFYIFEAVFGRPYAQAFINGKLFADNLGTLYPSDTALYYDANLYSTGGFWVGSYVQDSASTQCYIAEIIYYNRKLTDSERLKVQQYLNEKYEIY